jgi:hypothetical protein
MATTEGRTLGKLGEEEVEDSLEMVGLAIKARVEGPDAFRERVGGGGDGGHNGLEGGKDGQRRMGGEREEGRRGWWLRSPWL